MEQEFGMTELDVWNERLDKGRTAFEQWFGRLNHREQGDVMVYLSMVGIVQAQDDQSI
jgi:hypothetical protein